MGVVVALFMKINGIILEEVCLPMISYVLLNEIWFVLGMGLYMYNIKGKLKKVSIVVPVMMGIIFCVVSIIIYAFDVRCGLVNFVLGLIACASVIEGFIILSRKKTDSNF